MKIIEVTHLQRSGGHAVIKWIANNFFSDHIDLETVDVGFLRSDTKLMKIKGKDEKEFLFLNQYIKNGVDNDEQCLEYVNGIQPELFIISYENKPIDVSAFSSDVDTQKIVLLRRFRNFYASFCKNKNTNADWGWLADRWIGHARYVKENKKGSIFFDKWVVDKDYREQIAKLNKLPFKFDRTKRNSGNFGNGSSFDGQNIDVKEDDLLNRYKQYNFSKQQKKMIKYVKANNEMQNLV